jgi:hypothetical protein
MTTDNQAMDRSQVSTLDEARALTRWENEGGACPDARARTDLARPVVDGRARRAGAEARESAQNAHTEA